MDLCRRVGGTSATAWLVRQVAACCCPGQRVVELGCGCGEALLHLAREQPGLVLLGLEVQPQLVALAQPRLAQAACPIQVVTGDVRQPPVEVTMASWDQVFCNPPFYRPDQGRLPPDPVRARARFELQGTARDFMVCGHRLLAAGGLFHMIHHAVRWAEIHQDLTATGFGDIQTLTMGPWVLVRGCRQGIG